MGLGQSFAFVLIPPLARDLGLSEVQTSVIFSISAIAWALTSATWGRASDIHGRRNIAILGLIGYAISLVALITPIYLVQNNILHLSLLFPLLILGRSINGLLGSATRPASFAYMADITPVSKRTVKFARLEASFMIGTLVGPLLGGYLFLLSELAPFYTFAFLGIVAAIGTFFNVENTKMVAKKVKKYKLSMFAPTVWPYLVFASILSLTQASLLQSIGFYVTDKFSNLDDIPLLISITFFLFSISALASQYLFTDSFKMSNHNLLIYGTILLTSAYIVMGYGDSIAMYYSSVVICGIGLGMVRPANSSGISISQEPEFQGEAAGHLGSVFPIGHILTPIIAMPLYIYNSSYLYYFSAILCFILFLFIMLHPIFRSSNV